MKIVVYNHADQYALSRSQVEKLRALLPKEYWAKVREFHLCDDSRNVEIFEYFEGTRTVFFSYAIKAKSAEVVERAVRELLVGLSRVRSGSRFYLPLRESERESYAAFVDAWLPKCLAMLAIDQ